MPLCPICLALDLHDLTDSDNDLQDIPHRRSFRALKASAKSCDLCALFSGQLSSHLKNDAAAGDIGARDGPIILRGRQLVSADGTQGALYALKLRCDALRVSVLLGLYPDPDPSSDSSTVVVPQSVIVGNRIRPGAGKPPLDEGNGLQVASITILNAPWLSKRDCRLVVMTSA
jgi:hypothetical protein